MRRLRVVIYRRGVGSEWRFRIKAGNGEIIAHGEGYQRRSGAEHAIDLLRYGMRHAVQADSLSPA